MASYYNFLAIGIDTDEILWSEIYKDFTLDIEIITAAKPVYYTDSNN